MNLITCTDASADFLGFFTLSVAPDLLFYSYIPISILTIVLTTFVLIKDRFSPRSTLLFLLAFFLAAFLVNEIILWTAVPAGLIYTSWSLSMLWRVGIYLSTLVFVYVYTQKRFPPPWAQLLAFVLLIPIIILLPTPLNVTGVDVVECVGINGPLWYYMYFLEGLCVLGLFLLMVKTFVEYSRSPDHDKSGSRYLLAGSFLLLLFVFIAELMGEFSGVYEFNLLGPIGMLCFVSTLSYMIVRFQSFNMKLLASQALIISILALNASELFFIEEYQNLLLSIATLVLIAVAGFFLIRSVKREVRQREEIQKLAENLKRANDRLVRLDQLKSEFVSIASHQLRSPLAAMLGYASMLKDGSFGKLPQKAHEAAARIEESARLMASSVEDYLNVSRIEAGHMKYNLVTFSLSEQVLHITDDLRPLALKQNLLLLCHTKVEGSGTIRADRGKTEQIIHNLINNAIKYTKQGTITVIVRDAIAQKRVYVDIVDTGIGMSQETLDSIFEKFERGTNANCANIHGTGLGLYTALKLAEAMGGTITAHSEGEGKGSRFTLELPLVA
jgi:signal transduction histidine kinase